ncbi:MAG: nuclear transport factor 2 family protein [Acidobacteriota bacterium]|nr:nuclear transport factor 2 family protein [Acidobacteriota bacterium]MDH3524429.1 nuclear transport factor 2 family protein [Acidobacteriota bacterium]
MRPIAICLSVVALLAARPMPAAEEEPGAAGAEVLEHGVPVELVAALGSAERAFAATVRAKDREAFASFVDAGAVFAGGAPLRGRQAILDGWAGLFSPEAPVLAWEPCVVEVEASGRIGFTSGPYWIETPGGAEVPRGTFFSVWERQPDGGWKIVLDGGTPPAPGPPVVDPCAPADPPP